MKRIAGFIRSFLGLLVLAGALVAVHYYLGHDPGGPCAQDYECRYAWNGVCLHATGVDPYCSRNCTSHTDCPVSWTCEPIETEVTARGVRTVRSGTMACVQPAASAVPRP